MVFFVKMCCILTMMRPPNGDTQNSLFQLHEQLNVGDFWSLCCGWGGWRWECLYWYYMMSVGGSEMRSNHWCLRMKRMDDDRKPDAFCEYNACFFFITALLCTTWLFLRFCALVFADQLPPLFSHLTLVFFCPPFPIWFPSWWLLWDWMTLKVLWEQKFQF